MLHLLAVMHREPGLPQLNTWDALMAEIVGLNVDHLIHLDDKNDALKPIICQVLNTSSETELNRAIDAVHGNIHSFASQTSSQQSRVTSSVKISQVLPQVGIFRGCTGGDCSSQFSFPYPNDPHEMVFFIEDLPNIDSQLYRPTLTKKQKRQRKLERTQGIHVEQTKMKVIYGLHKQVQFKSRWGLAAIVTKVFEEIYHEIFLRD